MLCQRPNQSMKVQFVFTKDALLVCGWNLIDFIAANLHFIREQEQKESPSCFYNCPCGTSTRSLCSSLFPAPVLSGGFVWKICSLKKSRRASEYLSRYRCHSFCTGNPAHTHIYQQGRCTHTSCMSGFSAFR